MKARLAAAAVAALLFAAAPPLFAETMTFEPSRDNTLFETRKGDVSNGKGPDLYIGCPLRSEDIRRTVIAFDLAAIPSAATVTSATLRLHARRAVAGNDSARNAQLFRLMADWGEGSSDAGSPGADGAAAESGDATWLYTFYDQSRWAVQGGDFPPQVSASAVVGGEGDVTWGPSAAMTADVQGWVRDATKNFGWIVVGNESFLGSVKRFDSREAPEATTRPQLMVEFELPASPTATPPAATEAASSTPTPTPRPPTATPAACSGDCDGDGEVRIAELIRGVRIALGLLEAAACPDLDTDGSVQVGIGELIRAVNSALGRCRA